MAHSYARTFTGAVRFIAAANRSLAGDLLQVLHPDSSSPSRGNESQRLTRLSATAGIPLGVLEWSIRPGCGCFLASHHGTSRSGCAYSFDTQPSGGDLSWMLATQYTWLLLYTTRAMRYAEIEITLRARNGHREHCAPAGSSRRGQAAHRRGTAILATMGTPAIRRQSGRSSNPAS